MDDRVMRDVPKPIKRKLTSSELFHKEKKVNIQLLRNHLFQEGRLEMDAALKLLDLGRKILKQEKNLLEIRSPIIICGDVHGQFYDLLTLMDSSGDPSSNNYLFLGDYVDRGSFSIECVFYLMAMKINYSETFFLLRGNHESRLLTQYFTFKTECLAKYTQKLYDSCMTLFDCLPLAALLDKKYFCVHGGISPEIITIAQIKKINRFCEPPSHGLFCDLLWSDPHPSYDQDKFPEYFSYNPIRGCANYYSYRAVCDFLKTNGLLSLIRAHEVQNDGFRLYKKTPNNFPSVVTVFSAPNYCDVYRNKGASLTCTEIQLSFHQIEASPHPYWLPTFENAFSWSLPYMADSVTQMLVSLLNICSEEELEVKLIVEKIESIKSASITFTDLRRKRDYLINLCGLSPPSHVTWEDVTKRKKAISLVGSKAESFEQAKAFDQINEIMPPEEIHQKSWKQKIREFFF